MQQHLEVIMSLTLNRYKEKYLMYIYIREKNEDLIQQEELHGLEATSEQIWPTCLS